MIGRAEKGIILKTSSFRNAAIQEANRDGAPQVELVDGAKFVEMFERVELGVKKRTADEGDNHLIELAVAGQAELIITRNIRDLTSGELLFDDFRIITPEVFLKEYRRWEQ